MKLLPTSAATAFSLLTHSAQYLHTVRISSILFPIGLVGNSTIKVLIICAMVAVTAFISYEYTLISGNLPFM
jgi:hypothetical protein